MDAIIFLINVWESKISKGEMIVRICSKVSHTFITLTNSLLGGLYKA